MVVCKNKDIENIIPLDKDAVEKLEKEIKKYINLIPKLSIVIPYFNTYEMTKKLLDSLVPQCNKQVEIILIDDGCNEKAFDDYIINLIILTPLCIFSRDQATYFV